MNSSTVLKVSIISATIATAFFAYGATAFAATCDTVGTPFISFSQAITEPDSGINGDWANDTFTENVVAWVDTTDNTTLCAQGTTTGGTFVTTGPSTPGSTPAASLASGITGTFTGSETWIFPAGTATTTAASTLTVAPDNSLTDSQFSNWQPQIFNQTVGASTYAFTYTVDGEPTNTWTNAAAGNSGDITNPPASSAVYVNSSGSDSNIGSQSAPFKTLAAAISAVADGGTVTLASDLSISSEVTIAKAVTIDGAGHTLLAAINNSANDNSNNAAIGIIKDTGDVTIKNLTVDGTGSVKMHDINIFDAGNVTLDGITVENASKSGITDNAANVTVNNVTTKNNAWGGINADLEADATNPGTTLTVTGTMSQTETGPDIWRDDNSKTTVVVNVNSQYSSETYTSAPGVTGTIWGINTATVGNETELRAALANPLVATITLSADIALAAELDVTRSVTIDGANHSVTATFNSASVIQIITGNNVTIKNLVENATGTTGNRGINIFKVTGITLDNVTAENNSKDGIVVNGSTVTVNNIVTSNNGFDGIDVDLGSGVTTPASLTVTGTSVDSEAHDAIKIDDTTKAVSVTDTNNQYTVTLNADNSADYVLTAKNIKTTTDTTGTASSGSITVSTDIPSGTVISGDSSWNGIVNPPTATTATVAISGNTTNVTSAIEVGSPTSDLTFDQAVKLTFAGQAGQRIGWYNAAGTFTEITADCSATGGDDQAAQTTQLAAASSCKMDVGSDLVVYTKHFSTFVTFTATVIPTTTPATSGGGGGGGGPIVGLLGGVGSTASGAVALPNNGGAAPTAGSTGSVTGGGSGQVLGASTYNFTTDFGIGATGADVTALQQVLIAGGYLSIAAPTGTFGPLTKAALIKYQVAKGISPQSGFVGPKTRAILNAGTVTTTNDEQKALLIQSLQKQLQALMAQIAALTASSTQH